MRTDLSQTLLLHGGVDAGGAPLDLRTDPAAGTIVAAAARLEPGPADEPVDCAGRVLLPAPAEPHAHLDKALTAQRAPNPAGDLLGAIGAWHAFAPTLDEADILDRARAAAHELIARGTTSIRTHVDVGAHAGERGIRALAALRDELAAAGLADLQVVALPAVRDDDDLRTLLEGAIAAGADVVGGCPQIHPDGDACVDVAVAVAAEHGLPLDLHMDEALAPARHYLDRLIERVAEAGLGGRATASHCVSLAQRPEAEQRAVAAAAAGAGVAVVVLPQTNLYLQARDVAVAPPRGLAPVAALAHAGVTVAAGADNVRDPFCALGRSDACETAALLVYAAHLDPAAAWSAVAGDARRVMGLEPAPFTPGAPAEVLAIRGASLADAVARASEDRIVVHQGRVVAATAVSSSLRPAPAADLAGCS